MWMPDTQTLRCSDVIYKDKQTNWDFKSFLALPKLEREI